MDLPDAVCPVFLDKMEAANLSSLPLRAPSRPAVVQKALQCLANVRKRTHTFSALMMMMMMMEQSGTSVQD